MEDKSPSQIGQNAATDLFGPSEDNAHRASLDEPVQSIGEGDVEFPEFRTADYELIGSAKFWLSELLKWNFWQFQSGSAIGSLAFQTEFIIRHELQRITTLLPEGMMEQLADETDAEFRVSLGGLQRRT